MSPVHLPQMTRHSGLTLWWPNWLSQFPKLWLIFPRSSLKITTSLLTGQSILFSKSRKLISIVSCRIRMPLFLNSLNISTLKTVRCLLKYSCKSSYSLVSSNANCSSFLGFFFGKTAIFLNSAIENEAGNVNNDLRTCLFCFVLQINW